MKKLLLAFALMAASIAVQAQSVSLVNVPLNIPDGTTLIPPTPIVTSFTQLTLALARDTDLTPTLWTDPNTSIAITLQVSYDGGVTYQDAGAFTAGGGIVMHGGNQIPTSNAVFQFAAPPDHIQGSIVVAGGPLVSTVSVSVQ